jgi:hypothetical protein
MIFLIEYDRSRGELVTFEVFPDSEKRIAEDARLELELRLNRQGVDHEVVILEAESEAAVRRTHRRYFENLSELASPSPR